METQVGCQSSRKREWLVFLLSPTEPCNLNFTDPEANIEIQQQPESGMECNYLVTVYLGYGIEVQVRATMLMCDVVPSAFKLQHAAFDKVVTLKAALHRRANCDCKYQQYCSHVLLKVVGYSDSFWLPVFVTSIAKPLNTRRYQSFCLLRRTALSYRMQTHTKHWKSDLERKKPWS